MKFRSLSAGILAALLTVSMGGAAHSARSSLLAETPFFQSDTLPWLPNIFPHARNYNGSTYVAFEHTAFDPYIMRYNHSTGSWSGPVKVGTNPLGGTDSHGNPALWIDDSGYLHVYYGSHGTPLKHAKSNNPENISSWTQQPDVMNNNTYPQLSNIPSIPNGVMLSYRRGTHSTGAHDPWQYVISTDGGNTFGTPVQVTKTGSGGDLYAAFKTAGNGNLHGFITNRSGTTSESPGREDVYHIYKEPNGNWFSANGTSITVPIDLATLNSSGAKIYDTGGENTTGTVSINFNSTGTVLIGFSAVGEGTYKFGKKPVGGSWSFSTIGGSASHWKDIAELEGDTSGTLYAYLNNNNTQPPPKGLPTGDIDRFKSTDAGATWTKVADITTGNTFGFPQKTYGQNNDARLIFFDTNDYKMYLWGDSGFLN